VRFIRCWIEAPVSSCIKEWLTTPLSKCGLGIPSFKNRLDSLRLGKRYALKTSGNENIRDLWMDSSINNVRYDALLAERPLKQALKEQKDTQTNEAVSHFLHLGSQGKIASVISELIPAKQVILWSNTVASLPGHIHNFVRKAIQAQLPTLDNLYRWGRAPSNLCPLCNKTQTNKHVFSNCGSSGALNRYTMRHNSILKLLVDWFHSKLDPGTEIYCDLPISGVRQVTDLFNNVRPDLVIKSQHDMKVFELTVCHESNFTSSRSYKLNKYKDIHENRADCVRNIPVKVYTCEVSALGFTIIDPKFISSLKIPALDDSFLKNLAISAIVSSYNIYLDRNI
jgi:hypothetical protein